MAETQQDNQLQIINPGRINRLLHRICQAGLQVLIRTGGSKPLAIRGRASGLNTETSPAGMRISNISEKGMGYIAGKRDVRIELVGMSTHVVFDTTIISRDFGSILVAIPTVLISVERRKNARFVATPDLAAFVRMGMWNAAAHDIAAPPVFSHYNDQSSWISIADMSEGGICAVTRFPSAVLSMKSGVIDENSSIILPMQAPIKVQLEVRWIKKIKEMVKVDGASRYQRYFRFGAQFVSLPDDKRVILHQYMQQLTTADAV